MGEAIVLNVEMARCVLLWEEGGIAHDGLFG